MKRTLRFAFATALVIAGTAGTTGTAFAQRIPPTPAVDATPVAGGSAAPVAAPEGASAPPASSAAPAPLVSSNPNPPSPTISHAPRAMMSAKPTRSGTKKSHMHTKPHSATTPVPKTQSY